MLNLSFISIISGFEKFSFVIISQPFKQKNQRINLDFFTKNCKTIGSILLL